MKSTAQGWHVHTTSLRAGRLIRLRVSWRKQGPWPFTHDNESGLVFRDNPPIPSQSFYAVHEHLKYMPVRQYRNSGATVERQSPLRCGELVVVLLLRLLHDLLELFLLLCELWLVLQPLLVFVVGDLRLAGDGDTLLHGRPRIDSLPPLVQVGELSQIYACEVGHIDPAEVRDVGDRVFVANEVLAVLEANVEDTVETFGLTDVSLGWVGNALFGKSVKTA